MPRDDGSSLCVTNDRPECSSESRPDWPLARTVVPERAATVCVAIGLASGRTIASWRRDHRCAESTFETSDHPRGPFAGQEDGLLIVGVAGLSARSHHGTVALFLAAATLMLNACASPVATTAPTAPTSQGVAPTTPPSSAAASHPGPAESTNPVVVGFAFAAEDIVAYYQSQGYACSTRQPSTKA